MRRTILGIGERENAKAFTAGGGEAHKAYARVIIGSAMAAYVAKLAYEGTFQDGKILSHGKWISIKGLDPISTPLVAVGQAVQQFKKGDMDDKTYDKIAVEASVNLGHALADNTYLSNFSNIMDMTDKDQGRASAAVENYLSNVAASVVPAVIRKYNQPDVKLDTSGKGLVDKSVNKIKAGLGFTEDFPIVYDRLGREQAVPDTSISRVSVTPEDVDPVSKEISRLEGLIKKKVLTPASKITHNGEDYPLTKSQKSQYGLYSGNYAKQLIEAEMKDPQWSAMSDAAKAKTIISINKESKKYAKEDLFPELAP